MRLAHKPATWAKVAVLAVVLVGAAVIPGRATSAAPQHCTGLRCTAAGSVLWTHRLPGSWLAQPGEAGTVSSQSAAYAATGGGLAVVGFGTTVIAMSASTGKQAWETSLAGFPAGSAIVGIRSFPAVVAVGVDPPAAIGGRHEVILSAATGRRLRSYPAAPLGGAVAATQDTAVIVGTRFVTDYADATGRALWRRATGEPGQTWRVSGGELYVADGFPGSPGVPAVRQISLRTGAEHLIRPAQGFFPGTLAEVNDGDLVFAGPAGVRAYSGTGQLLWSRPSAAIELADSAQNTVYLTVGGKLVGVDVATGAQVSKSSLGLAGSLYWVVNGVALGLDPSGLGEAWGYQLSSRRVVWSSASIPWPHFFVDLSGLGGSASQAGDIVLLASCAQIGTAPAANSAPVCRRPELAAVLISRRSTG